MDIATLGFKVDSTQLTKLNSELTKLKSTSAQADRSTQTTTNNISKMNSGVGALTGSLKSMLAAYVSFQSVKAIGQIADQYTLLDSKVKLVTKSSDEFTSVQDQIYKISQETGTSFVTNAQAFSNFAINMRESKIGLQEQVDIFETFNKALIVNGSSQQEAAGATLQFKQAMSSGVMAGEEFRGVVEGNTYYMSKLAEALDMDIGQLRELSREQKLTTEVVAYGSRKMAESVSSDFGKMDKTIGRGLTEIKNALGDIFHDSMQLSDGFGEIGNSFSDLARTIGESRELKDFFVTALNLSGQLVDGLNNIARSFGGMSAVASGRLSFFEFATMDAKELADWFDKDNQKVLDLTTRITSLREEIGNIRYSYFDRGQSSGAQKEALKEEIKLLEYQLEYVESSIKSGGEYIDTWRKFSPVIDDTSDSFETLKEGTKEFKEAMSKVDEEFVSFFDNLDELGKEEAAFTARKKATDDYIMSLNYVANAKKTETDFWLLQEQHKQDIEKETTSVINEEQEKRLETYWYYADQIVDSFKSGIYDGIMQSLGETENAWDAMWKGMLATMASVLAEMAARWAASEIANLAGWSLSTHHTGLWNLLDDEELAILQKGEMVIPQSQSDAIRSNLGSMNDGSFDALVQATNNANPDSWEGQLVGKIGSNYTDDIIGAFVSAIMTGDISASIGQLMSKDVAVKNVGSALKDQVMDDVLGFDGVYSNAGDFIMRAAGLAGFATTQVPFSKELLSVVGQYTGNKVGDILDDREFEQLRDYYEDGEISRAQLISMVNKDITSNVSSWDGVSPSPLTGGSALGGFFDSLGGLISNPVKSIVSYTREAIGAREAAALSQASFDRWSQITAGDPYRNVPGWFSNRGLDYAPQGYTTLATPGTTTGGKEFTGAAQSIGYSGGTGSAGTGGGSAAYGPGLASGGVVNKLMVPSGDDGFAALKLGEGVLRRDTMDVLSNKIENGTFGDEKVIELLNSILRAVVQTGSKTNKNTKDINNILNTIKATGLRTV